MTSIVAGCCTTRSRTPRSRSRISSGNSATRWPGSWRESQVRRDRPSTSHLEGRAGGKRGSAAARRPRQAASGERAQDVPGHGRGSARRHRQAGRPAAQHADARLPTAGETAAHRARHSRDYAPLAGRLGIAQIKTPLEDLAFKYLEPEPYSGWSTARRGAGLARSTSSEMTETAARASWQRQGIEAERQRPRQAPLQHLQEAARPDVPTWTSTASTTCSRCA